MVVAMANKIEVMALVEVHGSEYKGVLHAPQRSNEPEAIIKELREIIERKNKTIEQQCEYISEMQEEVTRLRNTVKMLTL